MGEVLVHKFFKPVVDHNTRGVEMPETEITKDTYLKLSLSAFTIILIAIVSFIFSAGIYLNTLETKANARDVEIAKRITIEQYEKNAIRDSIEVIRNRLILKKMQLDLILIKKKMGLAPDDYDY